MAKLRMTPSRGLANQVASLAVLTMLAGLPFPLLAFQPLITDDTGTQGSAGNQLELSLNGERTTGDGSTVRTRSLPLAYTRGLTDSVDIFAGFSYVRISSDIPGGDASGGGNPAIGLKWRFYEDEDSKTSLALKPEVIFPVSTGGEDSGRGTGRNSGSLTVILTQEVAFGAIHVNAGVARERYRNSLNNPDTTTTRASIAPVWDVAEQWKLALDLGTESADFAGKTIRSNFAELGAIYSPDKDLDFALGIIRSSDNDRPHLTTQAVTAGITWRFQ